ncbi:MAG: hypothetical protein WBQ25_20360 [Nitrososphaeraceae archaeon]|jgi:hypothetical protein
MHAPKHLRPIEVQYLDPTTNGAAMPQRSLTDPFRDFYYYNYDLFRRDHILSSYYIITNYDIAIRLKND